jgi:fucose permease
MATGAPASAAASREAGTMADAGKLASPGSRLWHNRNFNTFWLGQTLSAVGDSCSLIALPLLVLQATGSVTQMGLVTATFGIAQLLAGLVAGALVDKLDRRRLMILCDLGRLLVYASIPLGWLIAGPQIWLIYLTTGLGSALGMVFQVAYITAVPILQRCPIWLIKTRSRTPTAACRHRWASHLWRVQCWRVS